MRITSDGCSSDLPMYSTPTGRGPFNNNAAKAVLKARGTGLGIRARGQRATTRKLNSKDLTCARLRA
eukprot:2697575-Pyramimonas_sp.AAC.1